jgi:hypothetical protein
MASRATFLDKFYFLLLFCARLKIHEPCTLNMINIVVEIEIENVLLKACLLVKKYIFWQVRTDARLSSVLF